MKKHSYLVLLAFTCIVYACNQPMQKSEREDTSSISNPSSPTAAKTYLYRGVFSTIYDRPGVGTMELTMVEGSEKGTFVYKVDYGKGVLYEGKTVEPYLDHGTFYGEKSDEFGTIYVMKGQQPVLFYYRPIDNKLTELGSDEKQLTDNVLIGINPKDSVQTRAEILGKHIDTQTLGTGLVWSTMNKQIMDQKQADVKLNPFSEKIAKSPAYLLFNKDQSMAELFLPETNKGLILKRTGTEGGYIWTDGRYELFAWKGYVLRYKNGENLFAGDTF